MDPSIHLFHLASFQNVTEKQKACETDLAKAEHGPAGRARGPPAP